LKLAEDRLLWWCSMSELRSLIKRWGC
jgi:hypothetical protein